MRVGLLVAKVGRLYRARTRIGGFPELLPCEKEIFTVIVDDQEKDKKSDTHLSRTRKLFMRAKEIAKKQARQRGISFVENLDFG